MGLLALPQIEKSPQGNTFRISRGDKGHSDEGTEEPQCVSGRCEWRGAWTQGGNALKGSITNLFICSTIYFEFRKSRFFLSHLVLKSYYDALLLATKSKEAGLLKKEWVPHKAEVECTKGSQHERRKLLGC